MRDGFGRSPRLMYTTSSSVIGGSPTDGPYSSHSASGSPGCISRITLMKVLSGWLAMSG